MSILHKIDQYFRSSLDPRSWSNKELKKFAALFDGDVVNVSGWRDSDKRTGKHYSDYFINAREYSISNFNEEYRGLQGDIGKEFQLDLTAPLPASMKKTFDVVFNHTTLEHVFDFQAAIDNICFLSRDIVIVVVPFMQHEHSTDSFGDYWRFSPMALIKLLEDRGLSTIYISHNFAPDVYVFCIASRRPGSWSVIEEHPENMLANTRSGRRKTFRVRRGIWGHFKGRCLRAVQAFLYDIY